SYIVLDYLNQKKFCCILKRNIR
ncbi:hypothetical protein A5883_002298, partial [Enterococcus sp. 5B3_DIV0040]